VDVGRVTSVIEGVKQRMYEEMKLPVVDVA